MACAICGDQLDPHQSKLERHCIRHHAGQNFGWLEKGKLPIDEKYMNYEKYIEDPSITLVLNPCYQVKKAGRPKLKMIMLKKSMKESAKSQKTPKKAVSELESTSSIPEFPLKSEQAAISYIATIPISRLRLNALKKRLYRYRQKSMTSELNEVASEVEGLRMEE